MALSSMLFSRLAVARPLRKTAAGMTHLHRRALFSTESLQSPAAVKREFRDRLAVEDEKAELGGSERRINAQHAKGKLTARERLSCFSMAPFASMTGSKPIAAAILEWKMNTIQEMES